MDQYSFEEVVDDLMLKCKDILVIKAAEYAKEDRLHNFKLAAKLEGVTVKQALAGMMAKHTVSIYDMLWADKSFPMAQWQEKLVDHMNYLILLKAILVEEEISETNN